MYGLRGRDPTGAVQSLEVAADVCVGGDDEQLVQGAQEHADAHGGQQNVQPLGHLGEALTRRSMVTGRIGGRRGRITVVGMAAMLAQEWTLFRGSSVVAWLPSGLMAVIGSHFFASHESQL